MEEKEKIDDEKVTKPLNEENMDSTSVNSSKKLPQTDEDLVSELIGADDSISEHLTSASGSIENDRSLQEIEIFNQPGQDHSESLLSSTENISRKVKPRSFLDNASEESDNSTVAEKLTSLKMNSGETNAKSIMEEILNNDQFISHSENSDASKEESFNLFANVNLDDTSLLGLSKENVEKNSTENSLSIQKNIVFSRASGLFAIEFDLPLDEDSKGNEPIKELRHLEEILEVKEATIKALKSEIDSLREHSNTFTSSVTSTTEYRQLQEECTNKLLEYDSVIIFKNNMIQELSESLKQSVEERNELVKQVELFRTEIVGLQEQVKEASKIAHEHQCVVKTEELEDGDKKSLENDQKILKIVDKNLKRVGQDDSNICINQEHTQDNDYVLNLQSELKILKEKLHTDKEEYNSEIHRLRDLIANLKCGSNELMDLKTQLEVTHHKEMEDLRKYFEKKCADVEKNYSEEIYSQHSRKLSGSSSDLEPSMDLLVSSQPGPGGDTNRVLRTREDLEKLKENMSSMLNKVSFHTSDNLNEEDLSLIEKEIRNELNSLLKIGEKLEIKAIQSNYLEEINNLKYQLEECRRNHMAVSNAIQEVASSGEFELEDIVQSYERRLQEQVNLARMDIIADLDKQFQKLLSDDCTKDDVWPVEFLKIKENFTKKYEKEIETLKEEHEVEINKLKEEHLRILNSALDRARRRSLRDEESLNETEIKEKNQYKKEVQSLRGLISEIVSYFVQCEDTLNNTLVEELLKQGIDKNLSQLEDDIFNLDDSSGTNSLNRALDSLSNTSNVTRVHITPNFDELISKIENKSRLNDSQDISVELKNELGLCLKKLTQDANAILAMTCNLNRNQKDIPRSSEETTPDKHRISPEKENNKISLEKLKHEMDLKLKYKQELEDANFVMETLEKEKEIFSQRLDEAMERISVMDVELEQAKFRIAELVEQKELISVGYGEQGEPILIGLGDTTKLLCTLQEKARALLSQSRTNADPNILQLIEDLCRVSEKITDEAKKDRSDLVQQIEVADKKYKTTQKFLEEQAQEREMERDEAQKKIKDLQDQLKERDRDRTHCQLMSSEAQNLESQLEEATFVLQAELKKYKELELERDEAIEKVKYLRDIIIELEAQNEDKNKEIDEQIQTVDKLKCIIEEQHKVIDDLKNLDSFKSLSDNQELRRHIEILEGQLESLRISAELAGSEGATRQIQLQLFELETCLDKKTKSLEQLYQTTGTNCSSPSEEMSVRDVVRPQTPPSTMDDCEVPLQQLARIKEKLIRHNRAEETALKRVRDLEMQVHNLRSELDESLNEKEFMKKQINEHIVLISDLQIRLDHQRIKAEYIEKQTNTSLETKIYDLNTEIQNLQEKLRNKEKLLLQTEQSLQETKKQLNDLQAEIAKPKNDDEILINLQRELDKLRSENEKLKVKLTTDTQVLVDKVIQDKNSDIDRLREQLEQTQSELQTYTSLNLDRHDLKTIANLKNTGTSIEQILSIIDLSQPIDKMRRYDSHSANFDSFDVPPENQKVNDTQFLGSSAEISNIEKFGPPNLHYTIAAPLGKPNSTEILKSAEKKVRFEDTTTEIQNLVKQLEEKQTIIEQMELKLGLLNDLEQKLKKLQDQLDSTEKALTTTTETFQREQAAAREIERLLGVELAEKKLHLSEREKEIEHLKQDSIRKDDMCLKLSREKKDLQLNLEAFKKDSLTNLDTMISEKQVQSTILQQKLAAAVEQLVQTKKELDHKKAEIKTLMDHVNAKKIENIGLEDNLKAYADKCKCQQEKIESFEKEIKVLKATIKTQEANVIDKDCEIEILSEDMKRLENELTEADEQVKELRKGNSSVDKEEWQKLNQEIDHLRDLLGEKDKMIDKMKEDFKVVNKNLHSINSRIKEKGNIFDLSDRLKAQQTENAELLKEIHGLKAKLMNYEVANSAPVEAITDQLKKELNYSAQIDANILNAVSDQSLSSITDGQDVEVYRTALSRQKSLYKQLLRARDQLANHNLALENTKQNLLQQVDSLQAQIEKEKIRFRQSQIEDSKLLDQMRLQIEALLEERENFTRLLKEEKDCRKALEIQLEELKKQSSSTESSTKYKSLPNQDTLELMHLKTRLQCLQDEKLENAKKITELTTLKNQTEKNLKYTKEMLTLEEERNRNLEEKIRVLVEKEKGLNLEILQKKFDVDKKVAELEERKIVIDELEQEKSLLKKQKTDLLKALKTQTSANPFNLQPLSETTEKLIQELRVKTEENKKQLEYVEKLENEVRKLDAQIRSENRNKTDNDVEFRHMVARCDYLFAKTLKLESIRKSLIWQKRYLGDYLKSHRRQCLTVEALPEDNPHERHCIKRRHEPNMHFRSAVLVVMSIIRMQYLVKRWHNGIRKVEKINMRHYPKKASTLTKAGSPSGANFHVGQPVSNDHFARVALRVPITASTSTNPFLAQGDNSRPVSPTLSTISLGSTVKDAPLHTHVGKEAFQYNIGRDISWSGQTPPSKDIRLRSRFRMDRNSLTNENAVPLRAPQLLAQFQERFNQITDST